LPRPLNLVSVDLMSLNTFLAAGLPTAVMALTAEAAWTTWAAWAEAGAWTAIAFIRNHIK
jgi:hypothetical protein